MYIGQQIDLKRQNASKILSPENSFFGNKIKNSLIRIIVII